MHQPPRRLTFRHDQLIFLVLLPCQKLSNSYSPYWRLIIFFQDVQRQFITESTNRSRTALSMLKVFCAAPNYLHAALKSDVSTCARCKRQQGIHFLLLLFHTITLSLKSPIISVINIC